MQERKGKYLYSAKQHQWDVTLGAQTVTVWAVTPRGAKSQAMSLLGVESTANMVAKRTPANK